MLTIPETAAGTGRTLAPASTGRRLPSWRRLLAWSVLVLLILVTLFPFYWMIRTSLSTNRALAPQAGSLLPADFTWGAYERVLGLASAEESLAEGGSGASLNFWTYLRNSVIVATTITVGQVFFSAMAAYAFARLRWRGRDKVFLLFLTALLVPPLFTALPNFVLIKNLGLLGTYTGIVLPYFFMTPFAVFFLRQFFLGINREIEEAARVDGAGHFRIFFRIILPMSSAPVATLCLLTYITAWNEYLWPLLVGQEDDVRVLTVALGVFRSQTPQGSPDWAGLMAATLLAALPIIILFLTFGRRIVNSIQFSGIK
ncbi:carbohydrate ABC transporter permease [Streptomyces heilongjiangensis]|uniref:Carbohydrate ABC transporter permease n=1 Tax=Streptomyces heilongjiangensis TaxID=945052 RepID=A0ABW1BIN9_9ACTN|nr:carbohydrate ABC transporter permease [Streptomyces heilongjiangensis]MDC2952147.1 carbohydrate ABC transporter permease [Streptomyces heilongjiangensis]